jgi:Tol biopolymer transport system component
LKDLRTGEERAVTASNVPERAPVVSSNGAWVYFGIREGPLYPMYKINARGGVPQKVCADCGGTSDVSPDGNYVLYHSGEPWSAYCLNLITGARTLIASHESRIYSSRFSPDGKWIAFETDIGDDEAPRQILVAPFSPDHSTPESKWIPITAGNKRDFTPAWSEDGATVYFLSDRDGNRCIWAMRVNGRTKRPLGDAVPVLHLHRMNANVLSSPGAGAFGLSAGGGRLIFGAAQLSSTIYRIESPK